ncbi:RING finger and CHY zinc finger domain-containing protein 1-like [Mercenaria mercenaria]|uniref:RING finger and CHY zinc finger domain-containing protein 1-like n=1 Tax=Mercenaria mercenaria TaxID=6596 RepID=UPI001E1DE752|nr:RING finger and CHY zinc finger domain-containing protein 1-like [Mercenaria mercenaria]
MSEVVEKDTKDSSATGRLGCQHYARKCQFVSPCCKKYYACRVCHDEAESHEIDRSAVSQIKCLVCAVVQKVQKSCESCDTLFGKYFCEKCRLYDDDDKGQFHCDDCGLCRVGGRSKFFHCKKCDMCLSVKLRDNHKCVEENSRRNCAVCLEDLHTSRMDAHIPSCGHLIHRVCLEQCIKTGNYSCPTCGHSLYDMQKAWEMLDNEIANTPMPEEYRNFYVYVLCKDCHKESKVLFHVIGLKCQECGSYNTCRTEDPNNSASKLVSVPNGDGADSSGATGVSQPSSSSPERSTDNNNIPPEGANSKK